MPAPCYNSDLPESVHPRTTPTEAVVGRLNDERDVQQMVETLTAAGIDTDRIHILQGPEGIEFLNGVGSFLGRLFGDEKRDLPVELLGEGATRGTARRRSTVRFC